MSSELSTRNRILREAANLFASQGVKATTVAQIESAVGLRAGSGGLHRHFTTKDALVNEILESQLQRGRETADRTVPFPRPTPEGIRPFLEAVATFTLNEANASREVALIMLREGLNYPDLIRPQSLANDDIAYGATGSRLKALFAEHGLEVPADFDLDAFGYLIVAPLIFYRLKEWTSGQKVRGLSDERISAMWARLCAPLLVELLALLPEESAKPT
jgi:AcrR family transcriptional regulator